MTELEASAILLVDLWRSQVMDPRIVGKWRVAGAAGLYGKPDDPGAVWTFHPPDPEKGTQAIAVTYTFTADGLCLIESDARPAESTRWWLEEDPGETYLTFEVGGEPAGQRVWFHEEGRLLIAVGPPSRREGNRRVWLMPSKQGMVQHDREWLAQFSIWSALVLARDVPSSDERRTKSENERID